MARVKRPQETPGSSLAGITPEAVAGYYNKPNPNTGMPNDPNNNFRPSYNANVAPAYNLPQASLQGPTPNPVDDYDKLFRASIDTQRGQIDAQIKASMAQLAARELGAQQIVNKLPGEVDANYGQAQPALDAMKKTVADSNGALHVQSFDDPNAAMNPIIAAVAGEQAGRKSDLPYLQAGTNEIYTRQRGALDQAGLAAKGDLESKMSDYLQQNAMQDRQDKAAAADRAAQEDTFYKHSLFADQLDQAKESRAAHAQRAQENRTLDASEPKKGTLDWWKWNMQRHPNQAQQFTSQHGGAYANAQRLMGQGEYVAPYEYQLGPGGVKITAGDTHREKLSMKQVLARYKGPQYARLRAALRYQGRQ